jgi:hypothetical protein
MADTPILPTTEIDAVNMMIATIGMAPATSLEVEDVDVQQAIEKLRDISRQVQSQGWDFNTEKDYPLSPDTDGIIAVPPNIVTVKVAHHSFWPNAQDIVVRAGKLYDRKAHSNVFTAPIKATVVMLFDFEDLPQVARTYIAVRASRVYADNAEGLADAHTFSQGDEMTAWMALQNYEAETGDYRLSTRIN